MAEGREEIRDRIGAMRVACDAWRYRVHLALSSVNPPPETNFFRRESESWRLARLRVRRPSHEEVFSVLDNLSDRYLMSTQEERIAIRNLFDEDVVFCLCFYAQSAGDQIVSADDANWLRRGLAALSIADNRLDFRDAFRTMRELYLASVRAGIDPRPFLNEVAAISSTTPGQAPWLEGRWSARDHFTNFEETRFFKTEVEPDLLKQ